MKRTSHDAGFGGKFDGSQNKGFRGGGSFRGRGGSGDRGGSFRGRGGSGDRGGGGGGGVGRDDGGGDANGIVIYLRTGATVRIPGTAVTHDAPARSRIRLAAAKRSGGVPFIVNNPGTFNATDHGNLEISSGTVVLMAPSRLDCAFRSTLSLEGGVEVPGMALPAGAIIEIQHVVSSHVVEGKTRAIEAESSFYDTDFTQPMDFRLPRTEAFLFLQVRRLSSAPRASGSEKRSRVL